jgi:hypothetical protein
MLLVAAQQNYLYEYKNVVCSYNSTKIYQHTTFHGPKLTGQVLHSPQKSERPPFWNVEVTGLKVWHRCHIQWHGHCTKCNKKSTNGSKVDRGKDARTAW